MEITFFNLNDYDHELRSVLDGYFDKRTQCIHYHEVQSITYTICESEMHLIFYRIQDASACIELEKKMKENQSITKRIALCKSYKQGITAMANGSCYALQLPLQKKDILRCCNFIMEDMQHMFT